MELSIHRRHHPHARHKQTHLRHHIDVRVAFRSASIAPDEAMRLPVHVHTRVSKHRRLRNGLQVVRDVCATGLRLRRNLRS